MEAAPVIVKRLDGGASNKRGQFECTECGWKGRDLLLTTASTHVKDKHDERPMEVDYVLKKKERDNHTSEPERRKAAERQRRRYARRKIVEQSDKIRSSLSCWPLIVSSHGHFSICKASVSPGSGQRTVSNGANRDGRDAAEVCGRS